MERNQTLILYWFHKYEYLYDCSYQFCEFLYQLDIEFICFSWKCISPLLNTFKVFTFATGGICDSPHFRSETPNSSLINITCTDLWSTLLTSFNLVYCARNSVSWNSLLSFSIPWIIFNSLFPPHVLWIPIHSFIPKQVEAFH